MYIFNLLDLLSRMYKECEMEKKKKKKDMVISTCDKGTVLGVTSAKQCKDSVITAGYV